MSRILVVDDNDDVRKLVSTFLTEEGHKVWNEAGGDSALESMRANSPEILILDIMMPETDGYAVLKTMVAEGLKRRIKVLVLTAKSAESDWIKGYRLGADHYLTKPFTMAELLRVLKEVERMTIDQLRKRRAEELEKAKLLARLESSFGDL